MGPVSMSLFLKTPQWSLICIKIVNFLTFLVTGETSYQVGQRNGLLLLSFLSGKDQLGYHFKSTSPGHSTKTSFQNLYNLLFLYSGYTNESKPCHVSQFFIWSQNFSCTALFPPPDGAPLWDQRPHLIPSLNAPKSARAILHTQQTLSNVC